MGQKHTYEFVQEYFKQHNCELLETEYINSKTKMNYKCKNNHTSKITFSDFNHGYRCMKCGGKEKFTFEFVKNFFEKESCELLETEYVNSSTKMKYICFCSNESSITFKNFKKGTRCMKCGDSDKLTFEFVKNYFEKENCQLLETKYINTKTNMKYVCKCGNESKITFDNFKAAKRCMKCSGSEKLTFEFVKNYFLEQECELLETEYINAKTNMKYICKCGKESSIKWYNFQQGKRCMKCSGNEKLKFEFVKNYFLEQNCELLETEYINSSTKMKYLCKCKKESIIKWDDFKQGRTCKECGYDKQEQNGKHFKQYIFPSGDIRNIQGFEHFTLDKLVKIFKEDDIITKRRDMPKIVYELNGKEHRYYPDIWIKSINKIIEVKSNWTYKKELIKNIKKALATRKLNYDFEFWFYSREKNNIFSLNIL